MSEISWYKVWDGSHEKFRRTVLILAVVDLIVISALIAVVGLSLYNVSTDISPFDQTVVEVHHNESNESWNDTVSAGPCRNDITADEECDNRMIYPYNATAKVPKPYFEVVGARIFRSIQLIIFICQLFMTVGLIRGLIRTDTHSMRTWLIVTEIITTIILLVLVLYLFGDFKMDTVAILAGYLIYQFVMIRTVARFIRRTEIELTQFGSIVEF